MTPEEEARLLADARAKIVWGTRPAEVRAWLVGRGVDPAAADALLPGVVAGEQQELRGKGVRDALIGAPLLVLS